MRFQVTLHLRGGDTVSPQTIFATTFEGAFQRACLAAGVDGRGVSKACFKVGLAETEFPIEEDERGRARLEVPA